MDKAIIPQEQIERKIYTIRGLRVMLDSDLAELYGVETRVLNQAVKRNFPRFPASFMFQITQEEYQDLLSQNATSSTEGASDDDILRSQIVTSNGKGGRRYFPFVFTEYGVLMLANVLKSGRAVSVSVRIIETFVRLRQMVMTYADLAKKIEEIEARLAGHDEQFKIFQELILPLLAVNIATKRKIGFDPGEKK